METSFSYSGEKAYFSSDERKWISKIRKLAEKYPDEVRIIAQPETNDGCIYVQLPAKWMKVQPPIKRELTEEQKAEMRDRLANARKRMS